MTRWAFGITTAKGCRLQLPGGATKPLASRSTHVQATCICCADFELAPLVTMLRIAHAMGASPEVIGECTRNTLLTTTICYHAARMQTRPRVPLLPLTPKTCLEVLHVRNSYNGAALHLLRLPTRPPNYRTPKLSPFQAPPHPRLRKEGDSGVKGLEKVGLWLEFAAERNLRP